jgi:hypothetical protein
LNEFTGSRVVESIHSSPADRFDMHAGISDAAHQALLEYRGKHYEEMKDDMQKYFPRRLPGRLQSVMADPHTERNEQLKEMALTIQALHQKLEDSQLEPLMRLMSGGVVLVYPRSMKWRTCPIHPHVRDATLDAAAVTPCLRSRSLCPLCNKIVSSEVE